MGNNSLLKKVNPMTKVALMKCGDYTNERLKSVISLGLQQTGFNLDSFKNKRVILKPNLLMAAAPEKAITTHPEFFRAVAQIVNDYGGKPVIAESPAMASLMHILPKTGYDSVIAEEGIEIGNVGETNVLVYDKARKFKRFEISKAFFDADIILNLPKFKTHGITYATGAVKNLFGTIPGLKKSQWHTKAPNPSDFSEMLLDLNEALLRGINPSMQFIHIMDAIVGQEGEGPGPTGKPKKIGAVIIGENPIAVDYVAVKVVGLDVDKVRTITSGLSRDLGISSLEDIQIVGESVEDMSITDFLPTRHTISSNVASRWPFTSKTFRNLITEKPVPKKDICTLCFKCMGICPAKAIDKPLKKKKTPEFDYQKCIRCYCCMEICPQAAIGLKRGKLQWIMDMVS